MAKTKEKPNRHALIPTGGEVVVYPFVSFLILTLFGYKKVMGHYGLQAGGYDLSQNLNTLNQNLTSNILPNFATAFVWAVAGLVIYLLLWLLIDSGNKAIQATSRAHRFVYPSKESRQIFAMTIFGQLAVRVVAILGLVVWVLWLPGVVSWATERFYELAIFESVTAAILGLAVVVVFGAYLFAGAPIVRLIFLRPRVLSD